MKELYIAIADHLRKACPFLRTIDIDRGQMETAWSDSSRPAVAYPCALLRIAIARRVDLTPTLQDCEATLTITYATDRVQETAAHLPEEQRMAGLAPYDELEEIFAALQGWDAEGMISPFSRGSQVGRRLREGLFAERITFDTIYQDGYATD